MFGFIAAEGVFIAAALESHAAQTLTQAARFPVFPKLPVANRYPGN
jgi:hypothetical protein